LLIYISEKLNKSHSWNRFHSGFVCFFVFILLLFCTCVQI